MGDTFRGWSGVVTGGSSGIGRAMALELGTRGARVAVASSADADGDAVVAELEGRGGRGTFISVDVTDPDQVERLIHQAETRLGPLRFLCACAGVGGAGTAVTTSVEDWRHVVDVNLTGAFLLAKYGIPALERAGGGSILLVGSDLGVVGAKNSVAYCASKGGVSNLARALALDCSPLGIRVNCIAPGSTQTPMLDHWFDGSADPDAEMAQLRGRIPLGRPARAEEIAKAAVELLSDSFSYMTGAVVSVDGGVTASYGI